MRSISTLLFLFITGSVLAQSADADKVVIINCWGHKKQVDTVPKIAICKVVDIENGLAKKMSCWNIVTSKDTLKAVSGCKIGGVTITPKDSTNFKSVKLIGRYRDSSGKNDPILVLDGVVKNFELLAVVDPNDVQNIEVIKPVAAMAKYGPEGANGAIVVTSKKQEEICSCNKPYICGMMRRYIQQADSATIKKSPVYSHANCKPVNVIDGIVVSEKEVSRIDPSLIKSISILKGDEAALLYGCEGKNHSVIIIKTKKEQTCKLVIKDDEDGKPVPGATVLFVSKDEKQKFQCIADDNGVIITDKLVLNTNYQITVSSAGYILLNDVFENDPEEKQQEIFLERDIKTGPDVIVSVFPVCHYPGRIRSCGMPKDSISCFLATNDNAGTITSSTKNNTQGKINAWPNPVVRSGFFNLQFDNTIEKEKIIRIVSSDGRILSQQVYPANAGKNILQIPVDARWAAGIYFVQLLYENGRLIASEKMIIQ